MKKIIAMMMALAMVLALAACGAPAASQSQPEASQSQEQPAFNTAVPGKLVKEYMKQTCVRFGARYVGPRGAAPQSAQTVQQPKPAQTMPPKPAQPAQQTRTTAAPVLSSNAKESLEVANTLSEKGKNLQRLSTVGVVLLILAIIMAPMIVTISMAVSGEVYFFDDELTAIFWSIDFILLGLGVAVTPLSLVGLHFIGLGQIVRNTTK